MRRRVVVINLDNYEMVATYRGGDLSGTEIDILMRLSLKESVDENKLVVSIKPGFHYPQFYGYDYPDQKVRVALNSLWAKGYIKMIPRKNPQFISVNIERLDSSKILMKAQDIYDLKKNAVKFDMRHERQLHRLYINCTTWASLMTFSDEADDIIIKMKEKLRLLEKQKREKK
jgi:hypothetical protein